jgi:hypothetical protein
MNESQVVHYQRIPRLRVVPERLADTLQNGRFEGDCHGWRLPMSRPVANGISDCIRKLPAGAAQHVNRDSDRETGGYLQFLHGIGVALFTGSLGQRLDCGLCHRC